MAIVNPGSDAVQDTPYINWSKEIQQPAPNRATEIALKGFGSAALGAVEGLNIAKERGLQNDIYTQTEGMQDQFIAQLEKDRSLLQDQKQENQPASVKGLSGTLDTLNSAKQNGKLSPTDYNGRIDALAKQMRAENPGYRAYIDEQFERATGRTAANKYIAGLVSDINSYGEQKDAFSKSVLSKLMSEEAMKYPGMAAYVLAVQKDPSKAPAALEYLNKMVSSEHSDLLAREQKRFADEQGDHARKDAKENGQETASSGAVSYISSQQDFLMDHSGLADSRNLQSFFNAVRRGENTSSYTPEQQAQVKAFLDTNRARILSETTRRLIGPYSPKDAAEQAESLMKTQYDSVSEAIAEGRWNLASSQSQILNAQLKMKVMTEPQLKSTLDMSDFIHKNYPEYSTLFSSMSADVPTKLQGLAKISAVKSATPGGNDPLQGQIEKLQSHGFDFSDPDNAELAKKGVEWFEMIGDPKVEPEVRDALIDNLFSEKNSKLMTLFSNDIYQSSYGVSSTPGSFGRAIGKQTIFDRLLSPAQVNETWKMSIGNGHDIKQRPELWANMKNTAETWFRYVVQRDNLTDLSSTGNKFFGLGKGSKGDLTDVSVSYSDKSHDFSLTPPKETAEQRANRRLYGVRDPGYTPVDPQNYKALQAQVNALNNNLRTMSHIYDKEGSDIPSNLYRILGTVGPEEGSIVDKMLKALVAAHMGGQSDRQQ